MPYSNVVFIKLFLSLFEEDDRFLYQLNESQQLLYIKMLYMAGITNNHIPKNIKFICNKINYHHEEACFISDLARIKSLFQRFKESRDGFYYFNNFNELHNFIGKSKGNTKEIQRIAPEKSKRRVRVREEKEVSNIDIFFTNLSFKDTWESWLEVRKKMHVPNTNKALQLTLKKLHKYPIEIAIKMLEQSIERGWRGVFPISNIKTEQPKERLL